MPELLKRPAAPLLTLCFVLLLFASCGKLQEPVPTNPEPELNVHPEGWNDPEADTFHGNAVRAADWQLSGCQSCHGEDYQGTGSGGSCLSSGCHPGSPEDCYTCHGDWTTMVS